MQRSHNEIITTTISGTRLTRRRRYWRRCKSSGGNIYRINGIRHRIVSATHVCATHTTQQALLQPDTFDLLLTRSLTSAHIVDFNPYAPRTDPLLFTYEELLEIFSSAPSPAMPPTLRVVDSRTHPAATRNSPANQHNMIPREALELSEGRTVEEFRTAVEEEIGKAIGEGEER